MNKNTPIRKMGIEVNFSPRELDDSTNVIQKKSKIAFIFFVFIVAMWLCNCFYAEENGCSK